MNIFNLILFPTLVVCIGWALFAGYQNRKRKVLNEKIADELDKIIHSVMHTVERTKKYAAKEHGMESMLDSDMVSTLVTVLVKKTGNVTLSLGDFAQVGDDEYVSVYVDSVGQKIILSMDHALAKEGDIEMANFTKHDDTTFH